MIARLPLIDRCCAECGELLAKVSSGAIVHDDAGNAYCCHAHRGAALETLAHWRETEFRHIAEYKRAR